MAQPVHLRSEEFHTLFRLVGECRELGDDPVLWRRHLFAGLAGLVGAGVVMGGEVVGVRGGRTAHIGLTDWGWENGFNRAGWERAAAEMSADPSLSRTPAVGTYFERMKAVDGVSLSRVDLVCDAEWYRSWDYENLHRGVGIDHTLWCWRSVPGAADTINGLLLGRPPEEGDFTPRQKALVREALALIGPLVGGPLARFADPSPSALPPRVRQVLKCLLEGDGDKQAAGRLGISWYTVNGYTKQIFRYFGVQTRSELLARWVRRGWGAKCAWADDPSQRQS
jgi:DNA-binding CsgD family transcriptional regulator